MPRLVAFLCIVAFIVGLPLCTIAGTAAVTFVQNRGQWPADVLFRADLPGGYLYLKQNSLHYAFYDTRTLTGLHAGQLTGTTAGQIRAHGVSVHLPGSAAMPTVAGSHPGETTTNYFFGKDPSRWAGAVPNFAEVIYHDIYPNIDLRIYAYYQTLKYEFTVRPGGNPDLIQLHYTGADNVRLTDGRLTVETSVNQFRENEPYSFVSRDKKATEVPAHWALDETTINGPTARFVLPRGYDKSQLLTIDPELVFATYSGSVADNWANTATYDSDGNLYSGGSVFGTKFPTTTGAFQVNFGGQVDVAVQKFSPDGSKLLYATYLGGESADLPHSLVVNSQGELIILGSTSSTTFPVTAGVYQPEHRTHIGDTTRLWRYIDYENGSDLFVAKLSKTGNQLTASTYIGGSANDGLNLNNAPDHRLTLRNYGDELRGEVIVGPNDAIYVASNTASADFPVTDSASGPVNAGRLGNDAVVFQLSPDLRRLSWSTRLGGARITAAFGLRIAKSGTVFVCGVTNNPSLPVSANAYHARFMGGEDGFVARYDSQKLTALTYIGTDSTDTACLLDLSPDDTPVVYGLTRGRFPVSANTYSNTGSGQFIQALSADLSTSLYSTVVGSGRRGPDISPTAFLVNECGNIYLAGWGGNVNSRNIGYNSASSTTGLPITPDAYKPTTNGSNFYIAILERGAKSLLYATFMGDSRSGITTSDGDHVDGGTCRFDKNGVIYHAACSCRNNRFPVTAQAWGQTSQSDDCNAVGFKFNIDKLQAAFDAYEGTRKGIVTGCTPLSLTFVNTSIGGRRYEWAVGQTTISTDVDRAGYTFTKPGTYTITLRAYNPLNCKLIDSTKQVITISTANFQLSRDTTLCPDKSLQLTASGASRYVWTPVEGLSSTTMASPLVTPKKTTTYTVDFTNEAGCTARKTVTVTIDDSFRPQFTLATAGDCGQSALVTFTNQTAAADHYLWTLGNGDTLRTASPDPYRYAQSGTYTVTLTTTNKQGCVLSAMQPIVVENLSTVPNVLTPNGDGKNDQFTLGFDGAILEIYNRWGKQIFYTDRYANNWGPGVANGMYYYLLTTPGGLKCKGWVEVIE